MEISVKGKSMDVGIALRNHVKDQLNNVVSKYFGKAIDATVTFSRETHKFRTDISVHPGPRGLLIQGKSEGGDAYGAFEGALARIAKQLRRYKRRLSNHHKTTAAEDYLQALQYVIEPEQEDLEYEPDASQPTIIAEMETHIATLTVSEAVMRMDLANAPVVMFRNIANGGLNVVYKRTDGNVGWIDPANIG
jgi:ribosomal subunit interface protein